MSTASEVVRSGYFRAGIRSSESSLTDDELENGFDLLVDMLNEWRLSGIPISFDQSAAPADDLGVQKEALGAIKWGLAVKINAAYQRPPIPSLIAEADASYRSMLNAMTLFKQSRYGNLPIGSGSEESTDGQRVHVAEVERNF